MVFFFTSVGFQANLKVLKSGGKSLAIFLGLVILLIVLQKYLEGSNVQVADEMVNLIIAQRAYQLNSKAITTSDVYKRQAQARPFTFWMSRRRDFILRMSIN